MLRPPGTHAHDGIYYGKVNNIKTIFVNDYSEITGILRTIVNRFRRRTVFIAGSAADYGPWGRAATEGFLVRLAAALIDQDYRISSGFGLGIGGAIVAGATQAIYSSKVRSIDEQLILRPFPVGIADPKERESTYRRYREELLAQAGVAIFVMGNKESSGTIVAADGMREEFDLARRLGLHVIPIGASGFVSGDLWTQVMADFGAHFPTAGKAAKSLLERIGRPITRPEDLLDPVIRLVNLLSKE